MLKYQGVESFRCTSLIAATRAVIFLDLPNPLKSVNWNQRVRVPSDMQLDLNSLPSDPELLERQVRDIAAAIDHRDTEIKRRCDVGYENVAIKDLVDRKKRLAGRPV
jgi:hypothetical protein